MMHRTSILTLIACGLTACSTGDGPRRDEAPAAAPVAYAYDRLPLDTTHAAGTAIDSVFPMPEMIRRFRAGLPGTDRLERGATSRDSLVAAFAQALSQRDSRTLGLLTLSRAEFAYIYAPNAPELTRANGLPPQRLWDQLTLASEKGIGRALDRVGGRPLSVQRFTCPSPAVMLGDDRLHTGCTVRLASPDGTVFDGHLFGAILEHAGRFKFVGYANDM